jgi:hypothetical protein
VLAAQLEQVVCCGMDDARAARDRRDLRGELDQIAAHPSVEARQALGEIGCAAGPAHLCQPVEDGVDRRIECERHDVPPMPKVRSKILERTCS